MTDSFPVEIIEDIISRLPVKSILRCRSVSKTWLSLISHPSFNKLQFSRATIGFFISAYDRSTRNCHYLTAPKDGGPLTLLMTLDDGITDITGPSNLNGLICFTSRTWAASNSSRINSLAFVVNPATRKVFQLPDMNFRSQYRLTSYLYGFDESRNEHKVLLVKKVFKTETYEFMIYSMSSCSWRKIDVETPVGFDWNHLSSIMGGCVCVNSVVHTMLTDLSNDILAFDFVILAFDFVTDKFSVIRLPRGSFPDDDYYTPSITKIGGCLGVVLNDRDRSEFCVWWLQDYEKRVWVKEIFKFPKSWNDLVGKYSPKIDVNMDDEIVFCLGKVTENGVSVPVYNMKTKCFKSVHFTLEGQFASSKSVSFCNITCYVETIMPLVDNWSKISHGQGD